MKCLDKIVEAVQQQYGITITSRTRKREVVDARFAVMNALADRFSYVKIGKAFNMTHASVINAAKQHDYLYNTVTTYVAIYHLTLEVLDACAVPEVKTVAQLQAELALARELMQDLEERNKKLTLKLKASAAEVASYKPYKALYFSKGMAV